MDKNCTDKEKCELQTQQKNEITKCDPQKKCDCIEIMPLVDIVEDEHSMIMYFEIPGASPENVHLEVANHILCVEAVSSLCRRERKVVFRRRFQLNSGINISNIHAKTKNGILTVTLPKSEEAKTHKIPVSD